MAYLHEAEVEFSLALDNVDGALILVVFTYEVAVFSPFCILKYCYFDKHKGWYLANERSVVYVYQKLPWRDCNALL